MMVSVGLGAAGEGTGEKREMTRKMSRERRQTTESSNI